MLTLYQVFLYILLNVSLFFLIDYSVTARASKKRAPRQDQAHKIDIWA